MNHWNAADIVLGLLAVMMFPFLVFVLEWFWTKGRG